MTFSFYQSLRTVPRDLSEVSRGFHLTPWQRFWKLEAPFSMPGLIWNMMMSMSGGWFFVVASEAITVGNRRSRCRASARISRRRSPTRISPRSAG
jgi:NitT/TauT family transport system permease protein